MTNKDISQALNYLWHEITPPLLKLSMYVCFLLFFFKPVRVHIITQSYGNNILHVPDPLLLLSTDKKQLNFMFLMLNIFGICQIVSVYYGS